MSFSDSLPNRPITCTSDCLDDEIPRELVELANLARLIPSAADTVSTNDSDESIDNPSDAFYELHLPGGGYLRVAGKFSYTRVQRLLELLSDVLRRDCPKSGE
jgi:hypothetical protein